MHLDCVFSILGDSCCIMLDEMMGEASPTRRNVDEYRRNDSTGKYTLARENVEFSRYMKENGYHIIPIKGKDQLVSFLYFSLWPCTDLFLVTPFWLRILDIVPLCRGLHEPSRVWPRILAIKSPLLVFCWFSTF